ncbi:MAG: deoxyribonuclease IV [Phycisphaerales bacterium]
MLGSHLSVAGGLHHALIEAKRLKMETVQVFTKNQRQWKARPLDEESIRLWLVEKHALGWTAVVSHASYLINLASPDDTIWRKSIDAMVDEIERATRLEIPGVVVHPGSHRGAGEAVGIARIVAAIDEIIERTPESSTQILLETTVGGGAQIGGRFEHLAEIRGRVAHPERVVTCVDTCHITAAGYDISTLKKAAGVFEEFDRVVGLSQIRCFHLNDSKTPLGSHRDRHEHIGDGYVGRPGFEYIVNHPDFQDIPMILETEKGETEKGTPLDTVNLRRLRRLIQSGSGVSDGR